MEILMECVLFEALQTKIKIEKKKYEMQRVLYIDGKTVFVKRFFYSRNPLKGRIARGKWNKNAIVLIMLQQFY